MRLNGAERNALRKRVRAQDRELSLLREHVSLMRNSYRRLANEFVTQLEIVDNLVPETTQLHERQKPTESGQFELSNTRVARSSSLLADTIHPRMAAGYGS